MVSHHDMDVGCISVLTHMCSLHDLLGNAKISPEVALSQARGLCLGQVEDDSQCPCHHTLNPDNSSPTSSLTCVRL